MREKHTTIRVHMNPYDASDTLGHTLDKKFRNKESHVNPNGVFEVWSEKTVYDTYKDIFKECLEQYNKKVSRPCRRIQDENGDIVSGYMESILSSKRCKKRKEVKVIQEDGQEVVIGDKEQIGKRLLFEYIISAGNCNKELDEHGRIVYDDTGHEVHPNRLPVEVTKQAMKRFFEGFEDRYKHFKICYTAYHEDEEYENDIGVMEKGIEHIHIGVVPWADGYKRGMEKQASISKALAQMNFIDGRDDDGVYHTAYWYACDDMQKYFEEILQDEYTAYLKEKGMEPRLLVVDHPARGKGLRNLSPQEYRAQRDLEKRKRQLNDVYAYAEEAAQESEEIEYELDMLRASVADAEQQKEQMYRDIEKVEEHAREELALKMEDMRKKYQKEFDDYENIWKQSKEANDVIFNTFLADMDRLTQTTTQMQSLVDEYTDRVDKLHETSSFTYSISDEHLLAWMKAQTTRRNGQKMSYLDAYEHDIRFVMRKNAQVQAEKTVDEMTRDSKDILNDISQKEEEARQMRRVAERLSQFDFDRDEDDGEYER